MDGADFKLAWRQASGVHTLAVHDGDWGKRGLPLASRRFLVVAGLPEGAAGLVFAAADLDGFPLPSKAWGVGPLFDHLIPVGTDGAGAAICLSSPTGEVVAVQPRDGAVEVFVNSSWELFCRSLLARQQSGEPGRDGALAVALEALDPPAMGSDTWWTRTLAASRADPPGPVVTAQAPAPVSPLPASPLPSTWLDPVPARDEDEPSEGPGRPLLPEVLVVPAAEPVMSARPVAGPEDASAQDPAGDLHELRRAHVDREGTLRVYGALLLLSGAGNLVASLVLSGALLMEGFDGPMELVFGVVIVGLLGLIGWWHLWIGRGLRRLDRRVKTSATIWAALALLSVPIGTVFGVHLLVTLHSAQGTRILSPEWADVMAATPELRSRTSPVALLLLAGFVGLVFLCGGTMWML